MSLQAITAAYAIENSELLPSEKFLLVTLANYANHDMQCWPSQERLAGDTNLSTRQLVRIFQRLETLGYVEREARARRKDGARRSHLITLKLHSDTMSLRTAIHSDTMSSNIVTPCPSHSDTMSPKPSENQEEEPSARRPLALAVGAASALEERKQVGELMRGLAAQMRTTRKAS